MSCQLITGSNETRWDFYNWVAGNNDGAFYFPRKIDKAGVVPRFLFECAIKLQIKPLTSASAAIIFHRFFKEVEATDYDAYVSKGVKKEVFLKPKTI